MFITKIYYSRKHRVKAAREKNTLLESRKVQHRLPVFFLVQGYVGECSL